MKLSTFRRHLDSLSDLNFVLPDGSKVPAHFHITEAGLNTRHFIDCGGTIRTEKHVNFQLWVANDTDHRLAPAKLEKIIAIAEPLFGEVDLDLEVEYQRESINRFGLSFDGKSFHLVPKFTDCLAKDNCGVPQEKKKVSLASLGQQPVEACCSPEAGCC